VNEPAPAPASRRSWFPFASLPIAALLALVPLASLRALGAPTWLAIGAALAVFPVLPIAWHLLAEHPSPPLRPRAPLDRLALRSLLIGLVVLAVSLSALGLRKSGGVLMGLWPGHKAGARRSTVTLPTGPTGPRRHELESFIPADARMVVALSGSKVLADVLVAEHADARDRLGALEKCQIPFDGALLLIAVREKGTRLVVVRAPGITELRNLYCLIGVLGSSHVNLRFTSDHPPVSFEIDGLFPTPLHFSAVDDHTLVMSEGGWAAGVPKKLFTDHDTVEGPLAAPLERLDRGANLWAAGVTGPEADVWDLALDAHLQDKRLRVHATSTPPAGSDDRAELEMTVPSAFAAALPRRALEEGLGGAFTVLMAAGSGAAPTHP
jgi:hypothetical protein